MGRARLRVIGRASPSSSARAMSMGSITESGRSTRIGAPRDTWSDLAPMILALSNLVSFGGPIRISSDNLNSLR